MEDSPLRREDGRDEEDEKKSLQVATSFCFFFSFDGRFLFSFNGDCEMPLETEERGGEEVLVCHACCEEGRREEEGGEGRIKSCSRLCGLLFGRCLFLSFAFSRLCQWQGMWRRPRGGWRESV